jgi:hypothetical protein
MKFKKIIVFILLVFVSSCKKQCPNGGDCTEYELSWLVYSDGQTLNFATDSNETLTTVITESKTYQNAYNSSSDCSKYQVIQQSMNLQSNQINIFISHDGGVPKVDYRAVLYTGCCRAYFGDYADTNSLIINNVTYQNLRVLIPNGSGFKNIYYSKSLGILAFNTSDNKFFKLRN